MNVVVGCDCSGRDEKASSGNIDVRLLFVVHI